MENQVSAELESLHETLHCENNDQTNFIVISRLACST
jgi:hypothetical protein